MSAVIAVPATVVVPDDPAALGWPTTLPLEIAMGEHSPQDICESYGISREEWRALIDNERFALAVEEAVDMLSQEGAMFKTKLRAQAEGYLPRMWALAHASNEAVPARVQADIMMFAIKAAGLDASIEQKAKAMASGATAVAALQINLHLGDD